MHKSNDSDKPASKVIVQHIEQAHDLAKPYALIIGINGAIGQALATAYQSTHQIVGVTRDLQKTKQHFTLVQTDYSEAQLPELYAALKNISDNYAVIINAIGFLHNEQIQPEKRLQQISANSLSHYFYVNATLPALLTKHLLPLLPKKSAGVFAHLSAMVGSISDNKLGGWYGYRASKAALNMIVKTTAIELARSHKKSAIVAIHPGTTQSQLSAPFTKATPPERLYSTQLTAQRLFNVIGSVNAEQTGQFFHWDGSNLEW